MTNLRFMPKRSRSLLKVFFFMLHGYRSHRLKLIDIELSNNCNLRCKMCWFHGEQGIGDRYKSRELDTREVFQLVEALSCHRPNIYLGGTEPFIRKDFLSILEHIKKKNMRVSFTTNGTLLEPAKIDKLVKLGVDSVSFSIDGHRQLHDSIRGPGVFNKVTSAIAQIAAAKKKMECTKPILHVNIVINLAIISHLEETVDAIESATNGGVDFYRLHHLWFVTSTELLSHQQEVQKALGCMAPGARSHLISDSQRIHPDAIAGEMGSLLSHPKVRPFPDLSPPGIRRFYGDGPSEKKRCMAPFYAAVVKPDGDIRFCPDEWIDDYCVGNIRKGGFDAIWNNAKSRKFRKALWIQKQFTGCKRCSWMYSF